MAALKHSDSQSDLIVVGAGIVGLACALVAVEQGLRVQVVEREQVCTGASIRNFGFVTVTGQGSGATWRRARRSRDIWAHIAPQAGIAVEHTGLYVLAQRAEAEGVLRELLLTEAGADLNWLAPDKLRKRAPHLAHAHIQGALYSPHELRVEARFAVERLRQWLGSRGVRFHMGQSVQQVESGRVHLNDSVLQAERVVVCPGADLRSLFPHSFARFKTQLCQLQMLRIRPPRGYHLGAAVMSDLSLVRYQGFRELPGAARLEDRLRLEVPHVLLHGIHLIVVQSADGSLVVGDSHQYGEAMPPFVPAEAEELILAEMQRLLCLGHYRVEERWTGIYPSAAQDAFIETVLPDVQLLSVTSGTGMSTAFALAEECLMGERIAI
ncbi:MAG: TIGR03364 family FAD-dependent oxidoreductase [Rhodoferax sp.]|nr:TIGR03364 family FAD-dependent oxidoreductase [Rhodoferax sp.]